jgi:hypothetical protein
MIRHPRYLLLNRKLRRTPMERQISLFSTETDHDLDIWSSIPYETQLEIESIFAQILVENFLSPTEKEVKPDES